MPSSDTMSRQLKLVSGIDADDLEILSLFAQEQLSELFTITVEVLAKSAEVDFLGELGGGAAVAVYGFDPGMPLRYFHGELFEVDFLALDAAGWRYRLKLHPFPFRMGQNLDYRIFQDKTAVDIIKAVFAAGNYSNVSYKLSGSFRTREYCVQYRESDWDFVQRLMEEEGIYYFFEHAEDKHTLVLCDGRSAHTTAPGYATVPMIDNGGSRIRPEDHVWTWVERVSSTTQDTVLLRDYHFITPSTDLSNKSVIPNAHKGAAVEILDYPGRYTAQPDGTPYSKVLLESLHARRRIYQGECDTRGLHCGNVFTLTGHDADRLNQEYLVLATGFRAESEQYRSGGGGSGLGDQMTMEAIPASTPFRAALRTDRPVARGPESAVVTGQPGDVICTDQYGRVKVLFFWDRYNTDRATSSCWMRVSDPSAGGTFGHNTLPRVGQEVVVDFMNGDPDRPFVAGRLYNANQAQAWDLPANKTRSHWRSQTVGKLGEDYANAETQPSGAGFNEIYFEDKAGSEMVYSRAQRDQNAVIQRDHEELVWRNQHLRVGYNRNWEVKNNETSVVEDGDQTHTVKTGKRTTTVEQNETLTVNKGNMATEVKLGDIGIKADAGSITIEAMKQIQLKVGQSTVTLTPTGVAIEGPVTVSLTSKAQVSVKGAVIQIQGEGEVQATAPMITLN